MMSCMSILVVVFSVALAILTAQKLPYPYNAYPSQAIPESHLPYFKGGSKAPIEEFQKTNKDWLTRLEKLFEGEVEGVEGISVAKDGRLVLIDRYGYVRTAVPNNDDKSSYDLQADKFYIGPGRPLGSHVLEPTNHTDTDLVLVVACSLKGLLRVNVSTRTIEVLANEAPDQTPINYLNDVDIGPESGKIYFSSSTAGVVGYDGVQQFYDTLRSYVLNVLRGDVSGRLFVYDPKTRQTNLLLDNIFYANGVAVAPDESYVLVVETACFRVLRHWLKGPKAGSTDTFVGQLPGAPDGMARASDGGFWVSLVAKVSPLGMLAPYPQIRQLVARLLVPILPIVGPKMLGLTAALHVDADGYVVESFVDPTSSTIKTISSAAEFDGKLMLGSLSGNYISVVDLKTRKD